MMRALLAEQASAEESNQSGAWLRNPSERGMASSDPSACQPLGFIPPIWMHGKSMRAGRPCFLPIAMFQHHHTLCT